MGNAELLLKMYNDRDKYNSKFKMKTYMDAVEDFCSDYMGMFREMLNQIDEVAASCDNEETDEIPDEVSSKIDEIATEFVKQSESIIKKENKQPGAKVMLEYNMYAVMYIFPCILETKKKYSEELTKTIVKKWNSSFKNTNLQYSDYETINSGFRRKLCYITTAVCENMGFADDCEELTLLRQFRDGYMMSLEDGEQLVNEYYECAPGIVAAINTRTDSDKIYRRLYDVYISPCVAMIKEGKLKECLGHYKSMISEWGANIIC